MKKHYRHENNCLNCGTILEGKFCHNCGQENLQIKENFGHLMNHAISDYFHFDHQFIHTLRPLLFQPGKLTNEYMAGKRMQYLHPIKMYIFISLVFFVLFFKKNHEEKDNLDRKPAKEAIDSTRKVIANNPALSKEFKEKLDKELVAKKNKSKTDKDEDDDDDGEFHTGLVKGTNKYSTYDEYLAEQKKLPENQKDSFFERLIRRKTFDYKKKGKEAEHEVLEEIKHNVPKMMFVLLPLFALILRVTFWSSKKYYVEHLIFSFHLHCFIFLFLTIAMLSQWILPNTISGWVDFFVTVGLIVYIYKALRAVYHRGRSRTITKMIGMALSYSVAFGICMLVVAVVSAWMAV